MTRTTAGTFRAIVIDRVADAAGTSRNTAEGSTAAGNTAELREVDDDLLLAGERPGPVTIDVEYSDLNFKDALAITGRPGVAKALPLIAGIDLVGTVTSSEVQQWQAGDRVVLNGAGIGEKYHGGLAERARVEAGGLVALPPGLTSRQAAAIGTAGFTAMLSVLALEKQGVAPASGAVLVTGAAGGVGSIAVAILGKLGYAVTASSGRAIKEADYLRTLGASEVIDRAELSEQGKPLQSARWAGALDCVGSHTLANVLAQTRYGGTVTSCGLAQGPELPATVMPFILRGVSLIGVNSVDAPLPLRKEAWARLADDLDTDLLEHMTTEIPLGGVFDAARRILAGQVRGRTVVDVNAR